VAVVAVNNNMSSTPISVAISGGSSPCSMTPWVTSSSDSLASKPDVMVSQGRVSLSLGAQSVTTLVGKP
jgi:O-glycosyl hydrolase